MSKTVCIINQKGGVGKTTSAVNLAAAVGSKGYKTLLIDIDPQGNATSGFGINKRELKLSSYDLLVHSTKAKDIIIETEFQNVSIIPSSIDLAGAEIELIEMKKRESNLKNAIALVKSDYDFIFLDCPPSLGLITINALCAADTVLIPIQCEYYALEGLSQLVATVRQVKKLYNPLIDIEGILLTMYDGRLNLTQQVVEEVKRALPHKVCKTIIPRNVRLSEAPSFGVPVIEHDPNSKGAYCYRELAKEIIKNNKK